MTWTPGDALRSGQRRTLLLCWFAYTLAYTLRVNIAVVIPALVSVRGYSYAQIGLITGAFFVSYMFGQLIHGYLGDIVSSKLLIVGGLSLSALCNLGMVIAATFGQALLIWGLNGIVQSMLWAPIMKTLAQWYNRQQLERVSFIMALSMIAGYALSWGVSSLLMDHADWSRVFSLPAAVAAVHALVMLVLFRSRPDRAPAVDAPRPSRATGRRQEDRMPIGAYFGLVRLPGLLLIAVCHGLIREGIGVWFPGMLRDLGRTPPGYAWLVLVVVQLANLAGILLVRRVSLAYRGESARTLLAVFGVVGASVGAVPLLMRFWAPASVVLLAVPLALTHGLTPVMTSLIPFQYARYGRVSLTAGVLDFAIYLGAAVSGISSGLIIDRLGWNGVTLVWAAAAAAGLALAFNRRAAMRGESYADEIGVSR